MTVPTFVAVATGGDSSGTNLSVTRAGAAAANRVRVVYIYLETNAAVSASGWTEITAAGGTNANGTLVDFTLRVFWHRDDGTDPATFTFSWGGANVWRGYVTAAYDDVETSGTPVEAGVYNEDEGGTNTIVGTNITTLGNDRKILFGGSFFYNAATTFGNPNNGTRRGNEGALVFLCDHDRATAGTGPGTDYTIQSSAVETRAWNSGVFGLIGTSGAAPATGFMTTNRGMWGT